MNEGTLNQKIREALEKKYGEDICVLKISDRFTKGIPDFLICFRGKYVAIEGNNPGLDPEPIQEYYLNKIIRAGGIAINCTSVKEALDVFKSL